MRDAKWNPAMHFSFHFNPIVVLCTVECFRYTFPSPGYHVRAESSTSHASASLPLTLSLSVNHTLAILTYLIPGSLGETLSAWTLSTQDQPDVFNWSPPYLSLPWTIQRCVHMRQGRIIFNNSRCTLCLCLSASWIYFVRLTHSMIIQQGAGVHTEFRMLCVLRAQQRPASQ